MYIPVTYFGGSTSLIASGGVESSYISGSVRYKVHEFRETTGTFQILSGEAVNIDILVIGAGGGRGRLNGTVINEVFGGGGGAGGYIYSSSISLQSGSFQVSGGTKAAVSTNGTPNNGGNSYFSSSQINIFTYGGGGGGGWTGGSSYTNGANGGSGGGAAGNITFGGSPIIVGQGREGGIGNFQSGFGGYYAGGGGGGASAAGSTYFGGNGRINRILNGQTIWYSGGGDGGNLLAGYQGGSGSVRVPGNTPAGDSYYEVGAGGGAGSISDDYSLPGTVIIRYPWQNVLLWNCNCVKFQQISSSYTPVDSGSISYVEGNTGIYYEAQAVPILSPQYRLIVSGSENQLRATPKFQIGDTYVEITGVDLSFCQ